MAFRPVSNTEPPKTPEQIIEELEKRIDEEYEIHEMTLKALELVHFFADNPNIVRKVSKTAIDSMLKARPNLE